MLAWLIGVVAAILAIATYLPMVSSTGHLSGSQLSLLFCCIPLVFCGVFLIRRFIVREPWTWSFLRTGWCRIAGILILLAVGYAVLAIVAGIRVSTYPTPTGGYCAGFNVTGAQLSQHRTVCQKTKVLFGDAGRNGTRFVLLATVAAMIGLSAQGREQ
jgi:cytochrome c biogenesis factor